VGDSQTLSLIEISHASKTAKGERRKEIDPENETARAKREGLRNGG